MSDLHVGERIGVDRAPAVAAAAARLLVHRRGHVDVRRRRGARGTIMFTFVVIVCSPNWNVLIGVECGRSARSPRACRRTAPGSGRPSRTSASCRPRCGRSTCRTSSSARSSIVHLGHAERAGEHAVVAGDAARLAGRLHDAVAGALDRVGRADLGAGRLSRSACRRPAPSASSCARSTYSRWIIECPLCVSHSVQACTHAWQPMQRLGSTKNSRCRGPASAAVATAAARAARRTPAAPSALRTRHRADLVLGDLRDRVLRGDRQLVDALVARPSGTG